MEKTIIILDGAAEGKTRFTQIAKDNNYWVWNFNFRNLLSMVAHKIGWDGERNNNYYSFVEELIALGEKYFNSEEWYIYSMIDKFLLHEKATVAIIHNCASELAAKLQAEYNCYSVLIAADNHTNEEYCKTLNYENESYEDEVIATLTIMTKDLKTKGQE